MTRSVKILWRLFFGGLLFLILLFTATNYGLLGKMPSIEEIENPEADIASEIFTSDGLPMGKYYKENRSEVKFSEISPNIVHALIATEDQYFYDHSGIDAKAVARAIFKLGTDGGGSPIPQQLAKMMMGQGKGNFFTRGIQKLKEWIVAVKLERNFTKDELIALYLNRAPWGNIFGIRNASKTYFQKEPNDLSIEEAAVLVGMLKGFIYNPIGHPKAAIDRRNTVIGRMVDCKQHYLTPAQATSLESKPLITNFKKIDENTGMAPYFKDALAIKLNEWCKTHKNPKTGEPYNIYHDGLKIYTTINSRMQQYAEEAMIQHQPVIQRKLNYNLKIAGNRMWRGHENVIEKAMKYTDRWKNMKEDSISEDVIKKSFYKPVRMKIFAWNAKRELDTIMTPFDSIKYHKQLMQTSFAAMDPHTGEVKCWVGGIDYKWFKYDHVTASRQVGSTFKPFVYTLALSEAGYTPETPIAGGALSLGGKVVHSDGGTFATCLAYSKNIAPWRMIGQIGVKRVIEFAKTCGVTAELPPYYSIALGSAEIPMLQMLQGYTMFPNKGLNTSPILFTRIEDKNGSLIQDFQTTSAQVISEGEAYTMAKVMQGVIKFGTAKNLNAYKIPSEKAGKTGTTTGNTDGWFIGYTPELIAGTWVGCEDPFIRIYGGTSGGNEMAAPKWGIFMSKVYADKKLGYGKITEFEKPVNLENETISADAENRWYPPSASNTIEDDNSGTNNTGENTTTEDFFNDNPQTGSDPTINDNDLDNSQPKFVDSNSTSQKKDEKKNEKKEIKTDAAITPKPIEEKKKPAPPKPVPAPPKNDY